MLYNLMFLGLRPNTLGAVMPRLGEALSSNIKHGQLLGCFSCDSGVLNRFAVLVGYEDAGALTADRRAFIEAGNFFGLSDYVGAFEQSAFEPLPFTSPIKPGAYGPFYEIRSYAVAPGGLKATSDAWEKGIGRRTELSPLLMVMASREFAPQRLVHFWPYKSLDERFATRSKASKEGIWPAPGSSDHLLSLQSEMFVATAFSPLS